MHEIKEGLSDLNERWVFFGKKDFECPGIMYDMEYYINNKQLPEPCCRCYKALVFWEGNCTTDNTKNFFKMIDSFDINYRGKVNNRVVVFYFRDKNRMMDFIEYMKNKIKEFDVKGKIQWRRACKDYQDKLPKLWKNAKEFIPDMSVTGKVMNEQLQEKGSELKCPFCEAHVPGIGHPWTIIIPGKRYGCSQCGIVMEIDDSEVFGN